MCVYVCVFVCIYIYINKFKFSKEYNNKYWLFCHIYNDTYIKAYCIHYLALMMIFNLKSYIYKVVSYSIYNL